MQQITIRNYLQQLGNENVEDDILKGLMAPEKYISPKYFYDQKGSELFEEITQLEEYYPTRTEKQILSRLFDIIRIQPEGLSIIELGSGDPSKITLLFRQIPEKALKTVRYYPVDICEAEILKSVKELSRSFSMNSISGIVADFHSQLGVIPKTENRLFCFFGSTIGNFTFGEAQKFIKQLAAEMQPGDRLLLGLDMVKESDVLERAYNDSKGVTARFNLNILNVVNERIGSNFSTTDFEHIAFFNSGYNRIEMHLKARKDMEIKTAKKGYTISIGKDETIHTEYSHKFTYEKIRELCEWGGFEQYSVCHDKKGWFSVVYAVK